MENLLFNRYTISYLGAIGISWGIYGTSVLLNKMFKGPAMTTVVNTTKAVNQTLIHPVSTAGKLIETTKTSSANSSFLRKAYDGLVSVWNSPLFWLYFKIVGTLLVAGAVTDGISKKYNAPVTAQVSYWLLKVAGILLTPFYGAYRFVVAGIPEIARIIHERAYWFAYHVLPNLITKFMDCLELVVKKLYHVIDFVLAKLWNVVDFVAKKLYHVIDFIWTKFWNVIDFVATKLYRIVDFVLTKFWNAIKFIITKIDDVLDWLVTQAWYVLDFIGRKLYYAIDWLITKLIDFVNAIQNLIVDMLRVFKHIIKFFFDRFWDCLVIVWGWAKYGWHLLCWFYFAYIHPIFTGLLNIIHNVYVFLYDTVVNVFNTVYNVFTSIIPFIYNTMATVFSSIYDTMATVCSSIYDTICEVMDSVYMTMIQVMTNTQETLMGLFGTA